MIETTRAPAASASSRAWRAKVVVAVWLMTITASSGPSRGGATAKPWPETARASSPALVSIAAPSSAACSLVPVPTSQTRSAPASFAAAGLEVELERVPEHRALVGDRLGERGHAAAPESA